MSIILRTLGRILMLVLLAAVGVAPLPAVLIAATPVSRPSPRPAPAAGDARHVMDGESLVIEAEGGDGDWERIDEAGEQAIRSKEGARMSYRIRFARPGVYYVHLRSRLTVGYRNAAGKELEPSSTNDAIVTVGGAPLYGSDGTTRPEGMRCHGRTLRWTFLPKGPGSHTPDAIRNHPVHTFIPQPGVYELVIGYRSPAFVIDKIALTTRPISPP